MSTPPFRSQPLVRIVQVYLKATVTNIENYEATVAAMGALRVRGELICVFMLSALVYTMQGPFARMKGLDVARPIQGTRYGGS